jgi:hypothetical protein
VKADIDFLAFVRTEFSEKAVVLQKVYYIVEVNIAKWAASLVATQQRCRPLYGNSPAIQEVLQQLTSLQLNFMNKSC